MRWPGPAIPKVPADDLPCAKDAALVDRYEQLRRHALDGDGQGWRLGLALLHRRGMVGWMRAWDGLPTPPPPARSATAVAATPAEQPLVGVLAAMALACVAGR